MLDVPKDLGSRIVEAARIAVALHLRQARRPGRGLEQGDSILDGVEESFPVGGADQRGRAATDGGNSSANFSALTRAATLAESEAA